MIGPIDIWNMYYLIGEGESTPEGFDSGDFSIMKWYEPNEITVKDEYIIFLTMWYQKELIYKKFYIPIEGMKFIIDKKRREEMIESLPKEWWKI